MPICPTCGRKTQIVQKRNPQSGKDKGWTIFKHRCEIHGVMNSKVHKPRKGVDS